MPTELELQVTELSAEATPSTERPVLVEMTVSDLAAAMRIMHERYGGVREIGDVKVAMFLNPAQAREMQVAQAELQSETAQLDAFLKSPERLAHWARIDALTKERAA